MENQKTKQNNFVVISVMLSIVMILSVASKFSFIYSVNVAEFIILFLIMLYLCNVYKFKINSYIIFSVLLLAVCSLSYVFADYKVNVRENIICLYSALFAGFSMMFLPNNMKKKVLMVPVFISVWLSMVIFSNCLADPHAFFTEVFYSDEFYKSMALNINVITGFLVLTYPLFFVCVKTTKNKKVFIALMIFVFLAILLTRSRVAIAATFLLTLIFLLEYRKNKYVKLLLIGSVIAFIACIIYVSILKSNFNSLGERIIWWKTALLIFKENIFLGCGFCNYAILFNAFRPEFVLGTLFAHNIVLQFLCDTGILGLFSFIFLIISFYVNILDRFIESKEDNYFYFVLNLSITTFLFINMFDYSFFAPANMMLFFILFGSAFSIKYTKLKKERINHYIIIVLCVPLIILLVRPVIAKNYCKKGVEWYVAGQYKFAISDFEKAIKYDKQDPEYYAQMSRAYFALYDEYRNEVGQIYIDKAIEYNKKATEQCKYDAELRAVLSYYYWNNNRKEEAIEAMNEAIKYDKCNKEYKEQLFELKNS